MEEERGGERGRGQWPTHFLHFLSLQMRSTADVALVCTFLTTFFTCFLLLSEPESEPEEPEADEDSEESEEESWPGQEEDASWPE